MNDLATRRRHVWVCHHCSFASTRLQDALDHPYAVRENFGHWLYEHPHGDRGQPPTREIHSSDQGGCYLSPVEPEDAAYQARSWRDRPSAGGVF